MYYVLWCKSKMYNTIRLRTQDFRQGAKPLVCTPRGGKRATAPHTLFAPVHNAHLVKCKLYIGYFSHTHYPSTTVQ